ncbi:hypothetical protein BJF90_45625 [Pseudonocardia sp. CNS-004]|nr:hypothetical protein BJF90_45625 [Pseudonocardia sp. CNS-004]
MAVVGPTAASGVTIAALLSDGRGKGGTTADPGWIVATPAAPGATVVLGRTVRTRAAAATTGPVGIAGAGAVVMTVRAATAVLRRRAAIGMRAPVATGVPGRIAELPGVVATRGPAATAGPGQIGQVRGTTGRARIGGLGRIAATRGATAMTGPAATAGPLPAVEIPVATVMAARARSSSVDGSGRPW